MEEQTNFDIPELHLYEIDDALRQIERQGYVVDEETGELLLDPGSDEAMRKALDDLSMAKEKKIVNIALLVREREAQAKTLEEERKRLLAKMQSKEKALQRSADRLRAYALEYMGDGEKMRDDLGRVSVSVRMSESTKIDDVDALPDGLFTIERRAAPSAEIKAAIKERGAIPGAHIEVGRSLQIR